KKKHVARTRYTGRPGRGRNASKAQTASGAPAAVPTLDQVNASKGKNQAASIGTQKPGKKEKIRYGQAPRETLPTGDTRQVDAGANTPAPQQQVAINQSGISPDLAAAPAASADTTTEKKKSRYTDRLKEPKQKREQQKKQEWAATHHEKFVPPKQTPEEQAETQRKDAALGLRGDTTKVKKANPAKSGPKRRINDRDKKQGDQPQQSSPTPAPAPSGAPASTPAQPQQ
ncbi:MAG TPA: hypothetical protein VKT75_03375, partial [Acidobacteriaceae bacterium]|nr:hypothetical protein [Acidobacteriaceae bacterium]